MLKNRELVFEKAERNKEMAEKYRQKLLAQAQGLTLEEIETPTATESSAVTDDIPAATEETTAELKSEPKVEMAGAVDE